MRNQKKLNNPAKDVANTKSYKCEIFEEALNSLLALKSRVGLENEDEVDEEGVDDLSQSNHHSVLGDAKANLRLLSPLFFPGSNRS